MMFGCWIITNKKKIEYQSIKTGFFFSSISYRTLFYKNYWIMVIDEDDDDDDEYLTVRVGSSYFYMLY